MELLNPLRTEMQSTLRSKLELKGFVSQRIVVTSINIFTPTYRKDVYHRVKRKNAEEIRVLILCNVDVCLNSFSMVGN